MTVLEAKNTSLSTKVDNLEFLKSNKEKNRREIKKQFRKASFSSSSYKKDHFFNSRILAEEKLETDMFGDISYGYSDKTELGFNAYLFAFTNFLFLKSNNVNLKLKHEMFEVGKNTTSFSSFSTYTWSENSSIFASVFGLVNTYNLDEFDLNWGFYNLYHEAKVKRNKVIQEDKKLFSRDIFENSNFYAAYPFMGIDVPFFLESNFSVTFLLNVFESNLDDSVNTQSYKSSNNLSNILDKNSWLSFYRISHKLGNCDFEWGVLYQGNTNSYPFIRFAYHKV